MSKTIAFQTALFAVLLSAGCASAQTAPAVRVTRDNAQVRRALTFIETTEPRAIEEQVAICEIAAPPFKERKRAEDFLRRLRETGLQNSRIDAEGNVIAERPGDAGAPAVVLSGHLDTVFPEGTDVTVKREGTILRGPGISDDCRGLSMVIAVARAMAETQLRNRGTIYFVGTVGEEAAGNLRGVRHLLQTELKGRVAYFISLDGDGHQIVKDAVGSYRYKVTFKGPGGHSFEHFGMPNPAHAAGRAIARIADFQVPASPKVTFSVGTMQAGTSVNAIAAAASFEVDMRAETADALDAIDAQFKGAMQQALADENARWPASGVKLIVELDRWGNRPAGVQPDNAPIVVAAVESARAVGITTTFRAGSTDANLPIGMRIPAVTTGTGGHNGGTHSLSEWWDSRDSYRATQWALLLTLSLAGLK